MEQDTIVAVATPPGRGGIGVIRVSGDETLSVLSGLCPKRKGWPDRRAVVAGVVDTSGSRLDEAVVTYYQGPRSYTGEDMVEISCHGSPLVLDRIVAEALARGCRAARPGEFTLRAFLSGRIDLTQAEAIVDLVEARTDAGLGLALRQLEGELSNRIEPLRSRLLDVLAHTTALVDFSEDDIPDLAVSDVRQSLESVRKGVDGLIEGAKTGAVLQHGVSVAIIGAPNVGKSSILNALLGRDRAIVTPIAGTTRDTVEDEIQLEGILFRVMDTAGLTTTTNIVESIGIERSRKALELADVVLLVLDGSRTLNTDDLQALEAAACLTNERPSTAPLAIDDPQSSNRAGGPTYSGSSSPPVNPGDPRGRDLVSVPTHDRSTYHRIADEYRLELDTDGGLPRDSTVLIALNKSDLPPALDAGELPVKRDTRVVSTSTVVPEGLQQLRRALPQIVLNGHETEGFVVSNARHTQSLADASEALGNALVTLNEGLPLDLVSLDMRQALGALSAVTGVEVGDDVLDRVFSKFCIGK